MQISIKNQTIYYSPSARTSHPTALGAARAEQLHFLMKLGITKAVAYLIINRWIDIKYVMEHWDEINDTSIKTPPSSSDGPAA